MAIETEYAFTLPRGYVDAAGGLHRTGRMRLATALDEIQVLQDPRSQANDGCIPFLLLSRVLTALGSLSEITPEVVGNLFIIDLAFLEDLYLRINRPELVVLAVTCPQCTNRFDVQAAPLEG